MRGVLKGLTQGWLVFVRWFGTAQMFLLLTGTYWLMVPPVYLFVRFLSDPLRHRRPAASNWTSRTDTVDPSVYLTRQF